MFRLVRISCVVALVMGATLIPACSKIASRSRAAYPTPAEGGVRFTFFDPTATRVQLGGSWPENNWTQGDGAAGEANIGLMSDENKDGIWDVVVPLGPGRYQYVFYVNEATWHTDPGNPEEVHGGPTGAASEIVVVMRDGRLEVR